MKSLFQPLVNCSILLMVIVCSCKKELPNPPPTDIPEQCDTVFSFHLSRYNDDYNLVHLWIYDKDGLSRYFGIDSIFWSFGDGETITENGSSDYYNDQYHRYPEGTNTFYPIAYVFNTCGDTIILKDTVHVSVDSFSYRYALDTMYYQCTMQNVLLSMWGSLSTVSNNSVFKCYKWSDNGGFNLTYWTVLTSPPYAWISIDLITNDTTLYGLPQLGTYTVANLQTTCDLQLFNTNESYHGFAKRDSLNSFYNNTSGKLTITRSDSVVEGKFNYYTKDPDVSAAFPNSTLSNGYFRVRKYKSWYE